MLVLSRKPGESIVIDIPPSTDARRIVLHMLDSRGHGDPGGGARARIGIEATTDIIIHRKEIADRIESARH